MKTIFRKQENENQSEMEFEQKFIEDKEKVPEGWTTDLESLNIETPISELEELKQENTLLKERCDATDNAVLELTDLILSGGE